MPGKTDGTPDAIGEDPPDLRDMIVKAKWEQVHAEETGQAPR
jgi:hypothetical protein